MCGEFTYVKNAYTRKCVGIELFQFHCRFAKEFMNFNALNVLCDCVAFLKLRLCKNLLNTELLLNMCTKFV